MEKTTGGWRKMHYEDIHTFCSSENIVELIMLRLREAGLVARMIKMGSRIKILLKILKGRDHLRNLEMNGRIILKLI
jgi:hypothetical protein